MPEIATFGAGCFWGVEEVFRKLPGVLKTTTGYAGGVSKRPTYEDVCTGATGHVEVVQVKYDPARISYGELLQAFWACHDPTELNCQGADVGTQYRSTIFYHDETQAILARASRAHQQELLGNRPLATRVRKAGHFYPAEDHHQKYLLKRESPGLAQR